MNNIKNVPVDQYPGKDIELKEVEVENERYYCITNPDRMEPFFMSIVSDSNHWMFISSNGGVSAGRKDSNNALFPYYTDDKITESFDVTGSKTIVQLRKDNRTVVWEPFSDRNIDMFRCSRNLYKNIYGNKVLFEEVNHDLELTFRYQWNSSDKYGFVKKSYLINNGVNDAQLRFVDGIQNIMPQGVGADFQEIRSNLVDAYKKNELEAESGLGIYSLSAFIVDRAEPSESLKANIAWSLGLDKPKHLLSSTQLRAFREGQDIAQEVDIKACRGAYFVSEAVSLATGEQKRWIIVGNVNQTINDIVAISEKLKQKEALFSEVMQDIEDGTARLKALVAAADGFQLSADNQRNTRHYSNTLFNILRGGIFDENYQIDKGDLTKYLAKASREVSHNHKDWLASLPESIDLKSLRIQTAGIQDNSLKRLLLEYMPLKFSRRHGDPSRPWNKFSINTIDENDGSKILDYEGNWRDIFQNWEALVHAYPEFIDSMIAKFLNASTFDGYNPYRVTKDGFDWEAIEPNDPWSYIGYWGDHQIIYLLKFLEFISNHYPDRLQKYFEEDLFVYANVPYKIKSFEKILLDPKDTIEFDEEEDERIHAEREVAGADAALLKSAQGQIHQVNFIEKILATTLAKVSNFIPEAGIWLNTQRPEWNDANNALVGNGVSMVTLCYLRRFLNYFGELLSVKPDSDTVQLSVELKEFFNSVYVALKDHEGILGAQISDSDRMAVTRRLGEAGSAYRLHIYEQQFKGDKTEITFELLKDLVVTTLKYLDHSIDANKRHDGLYHAYNIVSYPQDGSEMSVSYLDEMLEGQVAVLSAGYLSAEACISVLDAMKGSALFREDQYSYLLYPNKELPRFVDKNTIPETSVKRSSLLQKLLEDGNTKLLEQDAAGQYHFNGNFHNAQDVKDTFEVLKTQGYGALVDKDAATILAIFEEVFNHKAFTGRSGTFFGYEGLGSIYWHMVSKLLLAVEECCVAAVRNNESASAVGRLLEHYYEINEGIGVHKSPELYGAFPTDPYSHTPGGKGAQQPGMTGQVKEDILSRLGELGAFVIDGKIQFKPDLLRKAEFLKKPKQFDYIDVTGANSSINLKEGSMAFTYCQVPVIYQLADDEQITVQFQNGEASQIAGLALDQENSERLFQRSGEVKSITANIRQQQLK